MAAGREAERLADRGEWKGRGQHGPFQGLSQTWVLPGASCELSSLALYPGVAKADYWSAELEPQTSSYRRVSGATRSSETPRHKGVSLNPHCVLPTPKPSFFCSYLVPASQPQAEAVALTSPSIFPHGLLLLCQPAQPTTSHVLGPIESRDPLDTCL